MNPIKEYVRTTPCPFCGCKKVRIEKGNSLNNSKPGQWLLKCDSCNATAQRADTREDAQWNWEFDHWTYLTKLANEDRYTDNPECWKKLNNAIVEQAFRDLKVEIEKSKKYAVGDKNREWFLSDELSAFTDIDGEKIVWAAEMQVKYERWRKEKGCLKCRRSSCIHFDAYRWKTYARGKAYCLKEGDRGRSLQNAL